MLEIRRPTVPENDPDQEARALLLVQLEQIRSELEAHFQGLPLPNELEATPGQLRELAKERKDIFARVQSLWKDISNDEKFKQNATQLKDDVRSLVVQVRSEYHERMRKRIGSTQEFLTSDDEKEYEEAWDDDFNPKDTL